MNYPNNEEVRAWADQRYHGISARGPIPAWVIQEWDSKHPKRKYVKSEAHHGTLGGTKNHNCKCLRCYRARRHYEENGTTQYKAAA